MIAPARVAAFEVLRRVTAGRHDLPTALAQAREGLDDDRDRALATDIATGTERWRAALDHLIVLYAKRPIARLDGDVVVILRLSLYQLLHLTRVPASAVVNDAVTMTRRAGFASAAGLVNAVLRRASRERNKAGLPSRPTADTDRRPAQDVDRESALAYLSVTLSHPRWLAERWLDRLGFARAEAWMQFNNQPAPLTLRANPLRTTRVALQQALTVDDVEVGAPAEPTRYAPDGLIVRRGSAHEAVAKGTCVVQDEASQLVALLAGAAPGPLALDTCASPGGKATAIAACLAAGERLVACDVRSRRVALLQQTVRATGSVNVWLVQADLSAPLPFAAAFSTVVVDVPCSGLGTLRRDPDIRWRRTEGDLAALAGAQRRMLAHAAAVVRSGGRLVYATCSSEPEENEDVAAWFLSAHPDFRAISASDAHSALSRDLVDARGHLRTEPDRHGLEAFFGAVFERATVL